MKFRSLKNLSSAFNKERHFRCQNDTEVTNRQICIVNNQRFWRIQMMESSWRAFRRDRIQTSSGLPADSQRTPSGLQADSQPTLSRLPADSKQNPSRFPVDSSETPSRPKIQQTKMLVTCQRFGDLFLFGLVWQYSSIQKNIMKVGSKATATYLHQ